MARTRGLGRVRFVWLAGALLAALIVPSAALAVPTAPGLRDATVYQGGVGVTVWWTASTDPDAGSIEYTVYRDDVPMTLANYLANGEPVVTTTDTTVTVTPKADEIAKKFTYYYLVVATNTTTGLKAVSTNVAPNVHGGLRSGYPTLNCQLCHNVHGVGDENYLGAATRYKCYRCHGNTDATKSYGDKAVKNVQKDFYDYSEGQTIPATVSRHYNQFMIDAETECTSCHTPHKSPYYVNPLTALKEDAKSYTQLLSVKRSDATYFYSKDDAVAGNAFCLECHGSSATTLDFNAGTGAYDDTAGDHAYPTDAAHNTASVYANGLNANPAVQCEACHNKHASAADKLIAYRGDDTKDATTTYAQAELCYACHSAAGYAAEIAAGTAAGNANFAWNGRDVKAQFGKASKHPTAARAGGPVETPVSWTQTSQADFATNAHNATAVLPSGSVEIEPITSTAIVLNEGFESGNFTANSWTDPAQWTVNTTNTHSGTYKAELTSTGTRYDTYFQKAFNTSALTDPQVSFWWAFNGSGTTDYFGVKVSTDGTNFTDLQAATLTDQTTYTQETYALPVGATVYIRFNGSVNNTGEYVRVDDIAVSGQSVTGEYEASGAMVSTAIVPAGSLVEWSTLDFTETQPGGTNLTVDVLDAADDSVLLANAADGADLSALSASSLKLRANLSGAAPAPQTAADNFNDNSFDTAKWADVQLNSTDPDAGTAQSVFNEGFETAAWTTDFPTSAGQWERTNAWSPEATYSIRGGNGTTDPDLLTSRAIDLSGWTNVTVSFQWQRVSLDAGEYMRVQYSTDGTNYTDGWSSQGNSGTVTGTNNFTIASPTATTYIRLRVEGAETGEYGYWDAVDVTATSPTTSLWPSETGGALTLRAEGNGFGRNAAGTAIADEGEFTYIRPAAADWVDTQDFDMVVRVPSYDNLAGNGWMKAGLMIRTGTTEANAYATNAAMVGLYVTDTNGVAFQYRATAGGAASANTAGTGDAPVYLKLTRRGNVITGYQSTNGTSWTQVGSQTVTMSTYVLPGVSLTSTVNGTFSEATFDDFSITEAGTIATATPALLDWTVAYTEYPAVTTGSLTCVNCHNVHSVQKGTAGTAWQIVRASLPSNTKTVASGTPTQLCLDCHDGTAPNTAANSATVLVPYTVEFSDKSAYPFFPGWNKTTTGADWAGGGHGTTAVKELVGDIGCDTCHDPHASDNARLTAYSFDQTGANPSHTGTVQRGNSSTYAEEKLCYACHDNTKNGTCGSAGCHAQSLAFLNVQTPFSTTGTPSSTHPVGTTGRHSDLESGIAGFGPANRHSECVDCHDPHATARGVHTAADSTAGAALRGAWGVKPGYAAHPTTWDHTGNWTAIAASSYAVERMDGQDTDYEAYLCFKCHSAYSGQPFSVTTSSGTYTSTDIAMEFNPSNFSEHNVLGQTLGMETAFNVGGTQYTWSKPADTAFLKTGWTSNSQMTCTDCHTNSATTAARGPHGAAARWLIGPWGANTTIADWKTTYLTGSNMSNTTNICAKCHQNLTSANGVHNEGDHQGSGDGNCVTCHIKVPHGWKRPRLLGYTTDELPYRTGHPSGGGLNGVSLDSKVYNNWDTPDCATSGGCSHGSHEYSGGSW